MNTSASSPEKIDLAGLPGAEFVVEGLKDLAERRVSVPALLLEIAAPRLRGESCSWKPVGRAHAPHAVMRLPT